jgi:hypothetical protein
MQVAAQILTGTRTRLRSMSGQNLDQQDQFQLQRRNAMPEKFLEDGLFAGVANDRK